MNVLVVAAHPDDEILGAGGTIARHADEGAKVSILILGEGSTSRSATRDVAAHASSLSHLQDAANAAAKIVGASDVTFASLPDNRFDSLPLLDVVKHVESAKARVRPHIVYTHNGGDLNVDHQLTQQATLTAFRPQPGETVRRIYSFEVNSSTEWQSHDAGMSFLPDHFVEITTTLERKLDALRCYQSEMRDFPHSRSIDAVRALAMVAGSQVGVGAAERFRTLRSIDRVR